MEQGVVFGRDMLGYDVRGGQMFINENGADIVRLIFQKFVDEGKGAHTIARELREAGIKSYNHRQEWLNTVILRILHNEKYCGDLVQKKTYTPDYLSHDKKYNRGQEEFVILKNHHEPIVSRDMFEAAGRILDSRALSQEGKAKHSSRYAFSGKIKCGRCGGSYVARYKTRKDGSRYKAWRCFEANRNGLPHTDSAGNKVGCSNESIRDEDALYIMQLVVGGLRLDRDVILNNLQRAIQAVIEPACHPMDTGALDDKLREVDIKQSRLLDLYMGGDIGKTEYLSARDRCETERQDIQDWIEGIQKQDLLLRERDTLLADIETALAEMLSGASEDDGFYRHILNRMVVHDRDHIDVHLNVLPFKWSYAIEKSQNLSAGEGSGISDPSVPMSVSRPFSSSVPSL